MAEQGWQQGWRDAAWQRLAEPWDMVIVGGGITGAGILREAARLGVRALLVEQRDFAWGTSSRSSKLVHGGLRYLAQGQLRMTRQSVQERERLLAQAPGLVEPLGFLLPIYQGARLKRWSYEAALTVYSLLARRRHAFTYHRADDFALLAPHLTRAGLRGGFRYLDAQSDDSRLVLRLLQESVAEGALALNYVAAEALLREGEQVTGLRLRDEAQGRTCEVRARVVVNATGAWAERLCQQAASHPTIRPLRGSHLVFPAWRLPVAQAISMQHPRDGRPVFACPWEGATLLGTTDLDHERPLNEEPRISADELAYLMEAAVAMFPTLALTLDDITATFAGIRPIVGQRDEAPSESSREHLVSLDHGLLTVTGGKLTTFRLIALDALRALQPCLPDLPPLQEDAPALNPIAFTGAGGHAPRDIERLVGRYGQQAASLLAAAAPDELEPIPGTPTLWAEVRWAARAEAVLHLEDLLLRRVRLGLLLPQGGRALLPRLRAICQPELGWSDERWASEEAAYLALWQSHYAPPSLAPVPSHSPVARMHA